MEQLESDQLAAQVTIDQQTKHINKLKQQLTDAKITPPPLTPVHSVAESGGGGGDSSVGGTLLSPTSISSSSSYASLAPLSYSLDNPSQDAVKPQSFHLDLQNTTSETQFMPLTPIPALGRDLCLRFASFIKAYCELKQTQLQLGTADEDGKGLATVSKVMQGVIYWEKLAPIMESVMENTLSTNSSKGSPKSSNGSIGTATASTLAHLRVLSTIPSSAVFQSALRSIQSCWSAILPYLSALSANSSRSHSQTTLVRLVGLLADRCASLKNALEDASKKWAMEEKNEEDGRISSQLSELTSVSGQLTSALRQTLQSGFGNEQSLYSAPQQSSIMAHQQSPIIGKNRVKSPPSPPSLSSPDDSNISNLSSNNLSGDSIQSEANSHRLTQLHRQREHWRLEYHLLSHKFNKLMKAVKDRKADLESEANPEKIANSSILGEASVSEGTNQSSSETDEKTLKKSETETSETWRENMIRHHLLTRGTKLYLELTEMSSRAAVYQDECEAAMKRLAGSEEQRLALEAEVEAIREEKTKLSEELRTTCNSYEVQISTMSDHLADMNEKLASYEEKVLMLKASRKGKK